MGLLERFNSDKKINSNGLSLLEMAKSFDLNIVNGRFGSDFKVGDFTFNGPLGSSTIDYILVSDSITPHILDFSVVMCQCF